MVQSDTHATGRRGHDPKLIAFFIRSVGDSLGMPPLVLLDEYDTPIHVAFDKGYYDRMIGFMRNFMSLVFKDNTDIFRGVITGILGSAKNLFSAD